MPPVRLSELILSARRTWRAARVHAFPIAKDVILWRPVAGELTHGDPPVLFTLTHAHALRYTGLLRQHAEKVARENPGRAIPKVVTAWETVRPLRLLDLPENDLPLIEELERTGFFGEALTDARREDLLEDVEELDRGAAILHLGQHGWDGIIERVNQEGEVWICDPDRALRLRK